MKKIIYYGLIFFALSLFIGEVVKKLEFKKVDKIDFKNTTIKDFFLVSKGRTDLFLKGKEAVEKKSFIDILKPNGYIQTQKDKIFFQSKKGKYYPHNSVAILKRAVRLSSKDFILKTEVLNIDFKSNVAFNNTTNKIVSKNVIITGKNLFVNLDKEKLVLTRVRTVVAD